MKAINFSIKSVQLLKFILILLSVSIFISCEEDKVVEPAIETGTMTDIDGNSYRTVKIGNQWWMAENLKVTRFRNGASMQDGQSLGLWEPNTAAYCIYSNNTASPGLLYNWFAISDTNNIAPEGWHIPTDEEWKTLERQLGMTAEVSDKSGWRGSNEGEKLKVEGTQGWERYGDVWPTNESGFTALAGSCRLYDGTWGDPGLFSAGFWWSATEHSTDQAYYRHLDYKNTNVFRYFGLKDYGFSIRCVKD